MCALHTYRGMCIIADIDGFLGSDVMMIDWANFAPWTSLLAGVILGASAGAFALLNGRVAGISGMLSSLVSKAEGKSEKLLFMLGMLLAPLLWQLFQTLPAIEFTAGWELTLIAGVLVGFGTRYGSGCTSGHGICGLSRLSPRSMVAVLSFMATGFITVYVIRHLIGA